MYKRGPDIRYFFPLAATFLISCCIAVVLQQMWWLGLAFFLLFVLAVSRNPKLLLYLLIATIPWSVEASVTDSLSTDLPDEPLMLLCSFITVLLILYKHKKINLKKYNSLLLFLLCIQIVWIVVTVVFSTHILFSVKYILAKMWYILPFVGMPLLFFQNKKTISTTCLVLIVSLMVCVIITLIRHGIAGFRFETINPSLEPFFRNHVNYSGLLVCIIPLLFALHYLSSSKIWKAVLLCFMLIAATALYFSYARGAWLALLIGILCFFLLKKKLLVFAYLFVLFASIATVLWLQQNDRYVRYAHDYKTTVFHTDFKEHWTATYQLKDLSTAERFYRWIAGVRMAKECWQTGSGPATFYPAYKRYTIPAFKTWVSKNEEHSTVHNYFLLTLVEQGIIGFILLITLIGSLFYSAQRIFFKTNDPFWKVTAATVAVILSMICTINFLSDLIETDKIGSIFYLCLGTLIVGELQLKKQPDLSADIQRIT